jgi:ribA/ribD-fused uncharacterized protein
MDYSQYKPKEFKYRGKWIDNWFSNMVLSPVIIHGTEYKSIENYYQSMKSTDESEQLAIMAATPSESKRLGRKVKHLLPNWDQLKYNFMLIGLRNNFDMNPWFKQLLDTGDEMIIEWTNWGDKIWGVDSITCQGENLLGKALMEIRDEFKQLV